MSKRDVNISTDFFSLHIQREGRRIVIELHDSVNASRHHRVLLDVVKSLYRDGIKDINADHISLEFLNRKIEIARGKRRLDIVYFKDGKIHEVELKTEQEIGMDRTYVQLQDLSKKCENLILLVPQAEYERVRQNLLIRKIENITIDTYQF